MIRITTGRGAPSFAGLVPVYVPAGPTPAAVGDVAAAQVLAAGLEQPAVQAQAGQPATADTWAQFAVVWGGVPLCAWLFATNRGPASWLAGALGVGILYLRLSGDISTPTQPQAPLVPAWVTHDVQKAV